MNDFQKVNGHINDASRELISSLFPDYSALIKSYLVNLNKDIVSGYFNNPENIKRFNLGSGLEKLADIPSLESRLKGVMFYAFKQGLAFQHNQKREYQSKDENGRTLVDRTVNHHFKSKGESFRMLDEKVIAQEYFERLIESYSFEGISGCERVLTELYSALDSHEDTTRDSRIHESTYRMDIIFRLYDIFLRYVDSSRAIIQTDYASIKLNNNPLVFPIITDSFNIGRKTGYSLATPDDSTGIVSNKAIFEVPEYKGLIDIVGKALQVTK